MQDVLLARSLRSGNSICGLATTGECQYTFVPHALCSIEFLAHVTFTCFEATFSDLHIEILISCLPHTKFNPCPPHMHSSAGSHTHSTNVRTHNPHGFTCPAQDSNRCTGKCDLGNATKVICQLSCVSISYLTNTTYCSDNIFAEFEKAQELDFADIIQVGSTLQPYEMLPSSNWLFVVYPKQTASKKEIF